jgi:GT2 family glycosyltransferase
MIAQPVIARAGPRMSVVLATCNRSGPAARAIRSILANSGDFELVIVDQSEDDESTPSFETVPGGPAVVYHRTARSGLSSARNAGIRLSRGELIAMTDDDCEVPEDWLQRLADVFERNHGIGMVFGNVVPGRFDASRGFVPAYVRSESFLGRRAGQKNHIEGMGACMALRRSLWVRLGGFDETLGVNRRFPAAEEGDFALRALRSGCQVYETPEFSVTHHGFRTWEQGKTLTVKYWYGTGAMYAKNLKLAPLSTARLLAGLGVRLIVGGSSRTAKSLGPIATRRAKLRAFMGGFVSGLRCRINPESECFEVNHAVFGSRAS